MDYPTKTEDLEDDDNTGEELHEPPTIDDIFEKDNREDRVGVTRSHPPLLTAIEEKENDQVQLSVVRCAIV